MEKVSVGKGLLAGLVAACAGSLLAMAFLLGRISGSGPASVSPQGSAGPAGTDVSGAGSRAAEGRREPASPPLEPLTASEAFLPAPVESPAPAGRRSGFPPVPDAAAAAAPGPATAPGGRAGSAADPLAPVVAAYLEEVERIQPGKLSGSAEGTANEMAAALAKGDTSSLDALIRQVDASKERLAALVPPEPCSAHYRESLGSLDDAAEMLRSLKRAIGSPDPAAELASVSTRSSALRSRSEALQKEEQALRQRFGLVR